MLPLASGGQFDLAEHRDEVVVLDFWASWCGPCRSALPRLDRLTARLKEEGLALTVLTVNTSERERDPGARTELVLRERDAIGFTLPVGIDLDGAAARTWGVSALPTTVVITPAGLVASVHQGAGADYERKLEEEIRALLPANPRP